MTATQDTAPPAWDENEACRLARELIEDDKRMTPDPWVAEYDSLYHRSDDDGTVLLADFQDNACMQDDIAVARVRNNLRATAEQLVAAISTIAALHNKINELRCQLIMVPARMILNAIPVPLEPQLKWPWPPGQALPCDRLHAFADGELPAQVAEQMRDHLRTCSICDRELRDIITIKAQLSTCASAPTTGGGAPEPPWDELDPGIRETVRMCWEAGFHTVDSGDGSKADTIEGALAVPHVVMRCPPEILLRESRRLHALAVERGTASAIPNAPLVEATYSPDDDVGLLTLYGRLP